VTIILQLWWSLARGNHLVPSRWQATHEMTLHGGRLHALHEKGWRPAILRWWVRWSAVSAAVTPVRA
jgi:hypothetical protein